MTDRRPSREVLVAAVVLCGLAAFWSVVLLQAERTVFARVPLLDEVYYLDRAAELDHVLAPSAEPHYMSPLYPRLLSLTGGGQSAPVARVQEPAALRGVRIFQIACWLGVVILLRLTAGCLRRENDRPSRWEPALLWLPALLFALYLPAAVYTLSILVELPLVLLLMTVVWLLTRRLTRPPVEDRSGFPVWALVVGLMLGWAGLLRGTVLVLVPLVVFVAWRGTVAGRARRWTLVALLIGFGLALLPATIHNSRLSGRLTGPTLNGGVNFYIGNGPEANGFYVAVVPGDWRHDPAGRAFLAERYDRPDVTLAEADDLWLGAALNEVKARPGRWLGLMVRKTWLFVQGWEIDQLTPLRGWVAQAGFLRFFFVPFAAIAGLGLAGCALVWWRPSVARMWCLALVLLLAAQALFFVVSRYRLTLVPLLALLAMVAVGELLARRRRAWLLLIVALLAIYPWQLDSVRQLWRSLALANEARRWAVLAEGPAVSGDDGAEAFVLDPPRRDALARADTLYAASVAAAPDNRAAWLGLSAVRLASGDAQAAERSLARALEHLPGDRQLRSERISLLLAAERFEEALTAIRQQLQSHPADTDALHNQVVLLARTGRVAEAETAGRHFLQTAPDDPRAYSDLGILLARTGRTDEARAIFTAGLQRHPDQPELIHNLQVLGDR